MSNDLNNRLPLYAQVENVIIGRISNGSLPPGTRLPSEDSLVQEYAVSRTTIRAAIQSLIQRGLVEIRRGKGTFVTLASLPMAAVLLVAMFTVHLPYGFSSIKLNGVTAAGAQFGPPGYEVNLLYLACLAALVLGGPGPLAIDNLIGKRRKVRSSQNKPTFSAAA